MTEMTQKSSRLGPDEERVVIRLPSTLRRQMETLATSNDRSLSAEIRVAMKYWLEASEPA